jgi:flagellar export protein FliJ
MSTFKFRLQGLLRLRQSQRDEARLALADVLRSSAFLAAELARLDAAGAVARQQIGAAVPGPIDLRALRELQHYEEVVRQDRQAIVARRRALESEIDGHCEALAIAQRELRLLEQLAEREAAEFQTACDRRAQREVDELFAARIKPA